MRNTTCTEAFRAPMHMSLCNNRVQIPRPFLVRGETRIGSPGGVEPARARAARSRFPKEGSRNPDGEGALADDAADGNGLDTDPDRTRRVAVPSIRNERPRRSGRFAPITPRRSGRSAPIPPALGTVRVDPPRRSGTVRTDPPGTRDGSRRSPPGARDGSRRSPPGARGRFAPITPRRSGDGPRRLPPGARGRSASITPRRSGTIPRRSPPPADRCAKSRRPVSIRRPRAGFHPSRRPLSRPRTDRRSCR